MNNQLLILSRMLSSLQQAGLQAILLVSIVLPPSASAATLSRSHPSPLHFNTQSQTDSDFISVRESLKKNIISHPNDFITFETRSSANQFVADHEGEVSRETDRRVLLRGIIGYWQGKTLIVLPSLSTLKPL